MSEAGGRAAGLRGRCAPAPAPWRCVSAFVAGTRKSGQADDDVLDTAAVIASELATNAIAHARSPFRVSVSRTPRTVEIAVRDAQSRFQTAQAVLKRARDAARDGDSGSVIKFAKSAVSLAQPLH